MIKETRKQREARRKALGLTNPKKDWWAKRSNRPRLIGGHYIPQPILRQAKEVMRRRAQMNRSQKIILNIKTIWKRRKLKKRMRERQLKLRR